jgi:uncharacterized Fe-S center protein
VKARVYFTKQITPEAVLRLYEALGVSLRGNVAIKVHSGEVGNQNFIRPDFWSDIIGRVGGTVVECNTAYEGARDTTAKHIKTLKVHGWSDFYPVEILDGEGEDLVLPVQGGKVLTKNYVGCGIGKYDDVLVLSHFKGHPSGGFGGALKQLSIGCASSRGKALIHSGGKSDSNFDAWDVHADKVAFPEAMADAASSVVEHFKGNIAFINVMKNLSVDCDCCDVAEDPCMADIGILASLDPVAIDQACIDLIYSSDDPGRDHFVERVESRNGIHTIEAAAELGFGTREYELIEL